jgi:hypothetical protein
MAKEVTHNETCGYYLYGPPAECFCTPTIPRADAAPPSREREEELENNLRLAQGYHRAAEDKRKAIQALLVDVAQIFDGWHTDVAWTEWDESVRRRISAFLADPLPPSPAPRICGAPIIGIGSPLCEREPGHSGDHSLDPDRAPDPDYGFDQPTPMHECDHGTPGGCGECRAADAPPAPSEAGRPDKRRKAHAELVDLGVCIHCHEQKVLPSGRCISCGDTNAFVKAEAGRQEEWTVPARSCPKCGGDEILQPLGGVDVSYECKKCGFSFFLTWTPAVQPPPASRSALVEKLKRAHANHLNLTPAVLGEYLLDAIEALQADYRGAMKQGEGY